MATGAAIVRCSEIGDVLKLLKCNINNHLKSRYNP